MELQFSKWHGTGNDFILVDDRTSVFPWNDPDLVKRLCDRHFGIGSDGLILIQPPRSKGVSFHMEFFNPDASRSFCGNGSRCAFAFWCTLVDDRSPVQFSAIDGTHSGEWQAQRVSITLLAVDQVVRERDHEDFINNGSPHELVWVEDPDLIDLISEGRRRRNSPQRAPDGTNVNFIRISDGTVHMRTYERGVEDETLSCGTGVVAAALSALSRDQLESPVQVRTRGGDLAVEADRLDQGWDNIRLIGPAREVYKGSIII